MKPTGRARWLLAVLLPVSALAGCGAGSSTAATAAPTAPGSATSSKEGCEVLPAGPPGPVTDPRGPYFHQAAMATSGDGAAMANPTLVLDHASVPDGVRLGDGSLRFYYVNGAQGAVWVARLDGTVATPLGPISLDGILGPSGVVDPDAVLLSDGRVRLAYLSGFGSPASGRPRAMCLADSDDGVHFTVVGRAIAFAEADTVTDPSIARLADGSWLMAVSRGTSTILARSPDGLTFQAEATVEFGGVPELASLADGRLRLYVCGQGILSYVSSDAGRTWHAETTVLRPGTLDKKIVCDPSWIAGTNVFLFKVAD